MPDGVRSSEVEGVVEGTVDGLGVVALAEQHVEVRVGRWDGPDVLGAVQLAGAVFVVAVEPDGDLATLGEAVVVVPAEQAALVRLAVGADPGEGDEVELALVVELADPEGATAGVQVDRLAGDGLGLDQRRLLLALFSGVAALLLRPGLRRSDPVDGDEAEVTEDGL